MSAETSIMQPEGPDLITILATKFKAELFIKYLYFWEHITYSLIVVVVLSLAAYFICRKTKLIPERPQNMVEILIGGLDDFVRGILGPKGRRYTPFIGTLFVYILSMNLMGLVPLMKSPTASWSTTFALAICVFFYVQYTAIKEFGFLGYMDHLAGRPRGGIALSVILPLFLFILHIISELIKPISLSLRLRSNIWGDDVLLAVLAHFGIKGVPLLLFNTLLAMLTAIVQAVVFCLLTTIYFSLVLTHEEA